MSDFSSSLLLKTALQPLGYRFEDLFLDTECYTRLIAPQGSTWLMRSRRLSYPFVSSVVEQISRDKHLAHALADQLAIVSPYTYRLTGAYDEALLETLLKHAPLVVKPTDAHAAHGVTLSITDVASLRSAVATARAISDSVLVQQQAEGEEVRLVVFDGKVRTAVMRQTPQVIGNGQATLQDLLNAENQARAELSLEYVTYPPLDRTNTTIDTLDMTRVPDNGEVVKLGRGSMIKTGASVYDVTERIDGSYIEMAERFAAHLGSPFLVVDFIIQDITAPADGHNYVFLELNTAPALKLFYSCRDGRQVDILQWIVPMIRNRMEKQNG